MTVKIKHITVDRDYVCIVLSFNGGPLEMIRLPLADIQTRIDGLIVDALTKP